MVYKSSIEPDMPVTMLHLAPAILAALLFSKVSAEVSKCNATITGCMSTLHPDGRPTNIINTLKGQGDYWYMFVSSVDETKEGPSSLGFRVESDDVGVMTYVLPDCLAVSKEFPIAEGEDGEGYIVQTNDGRCDKLYLLFQKDYVICTYRCCNTCTGTEPDVGCAVAASHREEPKTQEALQEGLQLLTSLGLADNLVQLKHCSS